MESASLIALLDIAFKDEPTVIHSNTDYVSNDDNDHVYVYQSTKEDMDDDKYDDDQDQSNIGQPTTFTGVFVVHCFSSAFFFEGRKRKQTKKNVSEGVPSFALGKDGKG
jgi:hypothetical protein